MNEINTMLVLGKKREEEEETKEAASSSCERRATTPTTRAEAYYLRGQIFEKTGELQLALRDYQHALTINPNFINAAYAKAACQNKSGNYEEAIKTYNEAFALETSDFSGAC
jgi:tetratricopeptide (TPR) repeat protein